MAVIFSKFNSFLKNQMNGSATVDFNSDSIKVALLTSSFVPVLATQANFSDLSDEVVGSNYVSGGTLMTGVTLNEAAGVVTFDANDITWLDNATGFTNARYAVIYKSTGVAATSTLIAMIDFGADKSNVGGDFSIIWNPAGIITWA